jgi:pSer/pThr/pTyr-binding forkhead associated (FHA) protein
VSKGSGGGALLRLEIVEGPQAGTSLELTGPVIIGRSSARATFVIQDSEASRRHASLIPQGQSANIQDLGSTNGTFVNDDRIDDKGMLQAGDRLRIGTTVLEVHTTEVAEEAAEPEPEPQPEEAAEPEPEAVAPPEVEEEPEIEEEPADEPAQAKEETEAEETEAEEPEPVAEPEPEPEPEAEAEEEAPQPSTEEARAAEAAVQAGLVAKELHARLSDSFSEVLHAWSNRDPEKMRPFVSQAHLHRAREAADQLDRDFQINYIKGLELRDVAVRRPTSADPQAEPAEVYVSFVARDWIEDLRSGEVIEGEAEEPQAFTERWTFVLEGRRGWVIDRVEAVWSGPAEGTDPEDWLGLPPGSYSRRARSTAWRHWDGVVWDAVPAATG